jgi:hypothetical protein
VNKASAAGTFACLFVLALISHRLLSLGQFSLPVNSRARYSVPMSESERPAQAIGMPRLAEPARDPEFQGNSQDSVGLRETLPIPVPRIQTLQLHSRSLLGIPTYISQSALNL